MTPDALLDLHRSLVEIPSVSHEERAIADFLQGWLGRHRVAVERIGDNLVARAGSGPCVLLNSHMDTVPPAEGWTRDPWAAGRDAGRVYGLGANDAKGPLAAMIAAFLEIRDAGLPLEVVLLLVPEEETGGDGTEAAWPALRDAGVAPAGVVVGEPTGLDVAVAQKGMLVLELRARGDACHAAHAASLGARNAVAALARDLVALEGLDLGPPHPSLGPTTLQPTVVSGGTARNQVPGSASCWLDLRTVPGTGHDELVARVRTAAAGEVRVHSDRLRPSECPEDAAIVRAARRARPEARLFGSATMSDLVFFERVPAIKVGPGRTERSHTADEFILEEELLAGAAFYRRLLEAFAEDVG